MQNLKPLNSKEKKHIHEMLESQYAFKEKLDYVFLFNEKEQKIFIASQDIAKINLDQLNVNSIGIYFGQAYKERLRLSIEGSQIVGPKASKNILKLTIHQRNAWLKGEDMHYDAEDGFYLIKTDDDFMGTGNISNKKLFNFVPKPRRLEAISSASNE